MFKPERSLGGGVPCSGGTPNEPASAVRSGIIHTRATYAPNDGTALIGGGTNAFPDTPQTGDIYEDGDYKYTCNSSG